MGMWCSEKVYVRTHNNQDFGKFSQLIELSRVNYVEQNLNIKLWHRFWKALDMYNNDAMYQEVLKTLFGAKSFANVKSHKKNHHFNTNLL